MYATDLQYAEGSEKARLAMMGYKATGEQNTWGKINSWIPGTGITTNLRARNYAEKIGATDAWENIKEDTDNRLMKQGVIVGVGLGAAGVATGNPALAKAGLSMTSNFAGMLAFDQDEDSEDSNYIYR
jgi:hypothetical protein